MIKQLFIYDDDSVDSYNLEQRLNKTPGELQILIADYIKNNHKQIIEGSECWHKIIESAVYSEYGKELLIAMNNIKIYTTQSIET